MSGEKISRACGAERDVEQLGVFLNEIACALQDGKRRMALIEMTDRRLNAERPKQPPSGYP
jgi:hypothetical protein